MRIACVVLMGGAILFYIFSKNKWLLKLKEKISGLVEGALSVFKMPNKWPFFLLSVYIWFTYVLNVLCYHICLTGNRRAKLWGGMCGICNRQPCHYF